MNSAVDDHRDIRDALARYLEKNGMRATVAADVNGGAKPCHWGGAKVGQFGVRALELAALK